jgi:hypothetical protein
MFIVVVAMLAFGCVLTIGLLRLAWQLISNSPHQAPAIEDDTPEPLAPRWKSPVVMHGDNLR